MDPSVKKNTAQLNNIRKHLQLLKLSKKKLNASKLSGAPKENINKMEAKVQHLKCKLTHMLPKKSLIKCTYPGTDIDTNNTSEMNNTDAIDNNDDIYDIENCIFDDKSILNSETNCRNKNKSNTESETNCINKNKSNTESETNCRNKNNEGDNYSDFNLEDYVVIDPNSESFNTDSDLYMYYRKIHKMIKKIM